MSAPKPGDKVFYTRYALTGDVRICEFQSVSQSGKYWHIKESCFSAKPGVDAFMTWSEALAAIEEMRKRRLAAMEKQAKRLREMTWKEPT